MQSSQDNKENIEVVPQKQDQPLEQPSADKDKQNELLWVGNNKSANVDLKANFEKFKKQKVEQIKYRKYVSAQNVVDRKDPAVKKRLREKFLETAKKYFGVPYAKRYHQPGEPLFDAPIFLDCCALVRQITYDMREELGFYLDHWNQAYQYDTLPITLKFEELQPGDLVFYSAVYYNTKLRAQRHGMVHVEIYTGGPTGEQSIGARWQRGVVQYFDSYKFESKAYHSIQFHYKSIDTWLEGICRSWCTTHEWRNWNLFWVPDKKSIFNSEEVYDENDMDAPFIDEDQIDSDQGATTHSTTTSAQDVKQTKENLQCFIGLGNNPRLAKDCLSQYGFKEMSKGMQFSDKYRFKWTQTSSEINYMKFKEGEHIVNHISNAKIFTNKITTLDTLENLKFALESQDIKSSLRVHDFFPETYRLDIAADLVKFLNSQTGGLWLAKKSQSNQGKGIKLIGDVKKYKEDLLTIKDDEYAATDSTKLLIEKLKQMGIENENDQQQQQEVLAKTEAEPQAKKKWKDMNLLAKELKEVVVQKYMENPLLVDGRKFDIRAYMVVQCMKPYLVLYQPGYVRMSLNPYKTDNFEKDKITHLTNNSVQKNHPDFKNIKEKSIISIEDLVQDLLTTGKIQEKEEYFTKVDAQIQEIMKLVFLTVKDKLDKKFGCFELFGFDFLVDDQLNPVLIEINTNPALFTDTLVQKELLPKLVEDIVKMTLGIHKYGKTEGTEEVQELLQSGLSESKLNFSVVFQEL